VNISIPAGVSKSSVFAGEITISMIASPAV
jgi:hypothetical protein